MLAYMLQGFVLGLPAAATPGPLQAFYLSQTMSMGWRKTLPTALAPLPSDGPIILLFLLVLSRTPDYFLRGLRIAGGIFILYLAVSAFRQFRRQLGLATMSVEASHKGLLKAVLANLLNPNPYIFWGVVAGPILVAAWRESTYSGAGFMLGFYGTMISCFALLIVVFAVAKRFSSRLMRLISGFSALALFAFGLQQLWSGVAG